jgi:hypothetical protein
MVNNWRSKMRKPFARICLVVAMALLLLGCGSHEVEPAGPRQATTPDKVKLYEKPPKKYESLAIVSVPVTPEMRWDERGQSQAGFDALKTKAAALGANGLVFAFEPGTYDFMTTAGYQQTFYHVPMRLSPRTAMAKAVYVLEE